MDGDAALEKVDRDHQEPFLGAHTDHNPLDVGERPTRDTHALPFPEIWIGKDREAGRDEFLNGLDLRIGDGVEAVPALPEEAHEPARLVDFEVARLVHRVAQEEIAREHRDAREAPDSAPSGPRLDGGEEQVKALRGELVIDELLAVAVGPEDPPARGHRSCNEFRQGFEFWIGDPARSEEHTSELQSLAHLVCRLLLEKKKYSDSKRLLPLRYRYSVKAHE